MNYLLLLSVAFIWGSSFILMKFATLSFSTVEIVTYRVLTGALLIVVYLILKRPGKLFSRQHVLPLMLLSFIGYIIPFLVMTYLISRYDSGYLSIIVCLVPIMTILVSVPMLGKYPTMSELIGVLGGFGFILLLFKDGLDRDFMLYHFLVWMLVPLCHAVGNTYIKMKLHDLTPSVISCACLLITGIVLLPFTFGADAVRVNAEFPKAFGSLLVLGLVCTGLTTVLFYKLLQHRGPLSAGMVSYLIPLVALFWGWADGEQVTLLQIAALTGILFAVGITQRRKHHISP